MDILPRVTALLDEIDAAYQDAEITAENRDAHWHELVMLREVAQRFRDIADAVETRIAGTIAYGERVVFDGDLYEARRETKRTQWRYDELVEAVFDAVLVNKATGEIEPMTKLEKLRMVFPLTRPRKTALDALGLQADEYCTERVGPLRLGKVYR